MGWLLSAELAVGDSALRNPCRRSAATRRSCHAP